MNWEENTGNEITLSYEDEKSPEGSLRINASYESDIV